MKYTFHFTDGKSKTYEADVTLKVLADSLDNGDVLELKTCIDNSSELVNCRYVIRVVEECPIASDLSF